MCIMVTKLHINTLVCTIGVAIKINTVPLKCHAALTQHLTLKRKLQVSYSQDKTR